MAGGTNVVTLKMGDPVKNTQNGGNGMKIYIQSESAMARKQLNQQCSKCDAEGARS